MSDNSNEQRFKPGDIVKLMSGSYPMTVVRYDPEDSLEVVCTWYSEEDFKERSFNQDLLFKA